MSTGYIHAQRIKKLKLQGKTATSNGLVTPDEGYDGLASVDVNVSGGGSSVKDGYNIVFISEGSNYTIYSVAKGSKIYAPTKPVIENKYFKGWYEAEADKPTEFPIIPDHDMTFTARYGESMVIGFDNLSQPSGDLRWTDYIQDFESYTTETNGTYVNVKSPLDNLFPYNEIHEVVDENDNVFISFPSCFIRWKRTETGELDGFQVAPEIPEEDSEGWFIPDCFLDPRDDTNSIYLGETWIGKYEGWRDDVGRFWSLSGTAPTTNISITDVQTACRKWSFDYDYNGYQMYNMSQMVLYNFLCMLYYKTANIQTVYSGRTNKSSAADTGSCDGVTGLNGWDTVTTCVKMLGVENPYGNIYKFVGGIFFNSSTIYVDRNPVTKGTFSPSGKETLDFTRPTIDGYIKYLKAGNAPETQSYVYASATGGSDTTYVGDYCYYNSSGTILCCGGYWDSGAHAGLWFLFGGLGASDSGSDVGGRLSRAPISN